MANNLTHAVEAKDEKSTRKLLTLMHEVGLPPHIQEIIKFNSTRAGVLFQDNKVSLGPRLGEVTSTSGENEVKLGSTFSELSLKKSE